MAKIFRLFVSSTFLDQSLERNALQREVFPRLHELCARSGAAFQAVDMRWGVSRASANDQQTLEICLQEIDRCHRLTTRPNFIALLGDRAGWCPLPARIPACEYQRIQGELAGPGRDSARRRALLNRCYREDKNATPPVYLLRPWKTGNSKIERELSALLREATVGFNERERFKYVASATEQEIERGILSARNIHGQAFAFFRHINNVPLDHPRAGQFLDLDNNHRPSKDVPSDVLASSTWRFPFSWFVECP